LKGEIHYTTRMNEPATMQFSGFFGTEQQLVLKLDTHLPNSTFEFSRDPKDAEIESACCGC
jgi:hypothetical protein